MPKRVCQVCLLPRADRNCGLCARDICKRCSEKLGEDRLRHLGAPTPELSHRVYCGPCFDEKVAPVLADYESTLERAKGIVVFDRTKGEETRLMSRAERPLTASDCLDERETLMRLAFSAAKGGFNALLDVKVDSRQVRNEGFQTSRWFGRAVPAQIDPHELARLERLH